MYQCGANSSPWTCYRMGPLPTIHVPSQPPDRDGEKLPSLHMSAKRLDMGTITVNSIERI